MFTVDYPMEAECELTQTVIQWLKELCELLKSIDKIPGEESDLLMASNFRKIEDLIIKGERGGILRGLSVSLFSPFGDKKTLMNKFYFQQEGGLNMLMKVYGVLVSKEWGKLGIDKNLHIHLEIHCCQATCNYAETSSLKRQVYQLGGLEMSIATLLRRRLQGNRKVLDTVIHATLEVAVYTMGK